MSVYTPGPILVGFSVDETYGIVIRVTKQVVKTRPEPTDAGFANAILFSSTVTSTTTGTLNDSVTNFVTSGVRVGDVVFNTTTSTRSLVQSVATHALTLFPATTVMTSGNTYTLNPAIWVEYREYNKEWCYRLTSQIWTLPNPNPDIYFGTKQISLPDTLTSIDVGWDSATNSGVSSNNATGDPQDVIRSEASSSAYADGSAIVELVAGYRGLATVEIERYFTFFPPTVASLPSLYIIRPSHGTLIIKTKGTNQTAWVGINGSGISAGARMQIKGISLGPLLTNGQSLATPDWTPSDLVANGTTPTGQVFYPVATGHSEGHATWNVPASTPTSIATNTQILEGVSVEKWKLGLYMVETYTITVP